MEKTELAVGDSTRLEIILDTGRFMRKVTKKPRIKTNEGPPGKQVEIVCNVVDRPDSTYPIVIKPYKLDLTQFGRKVRDQVTFKITNVSDRPLTPSVLASAGRYFEVKLPDAIEPGESGEAKIKLKESALEEEFEKSFTLVLDDPLATRFTVPVKRKLRPSIKQAADSNEESDQGQ